MQNYLIFWYDGNDYHTTVVNSHSYEAALMALDEANKGERAIDINAVVMFKSSQDVIRAWDNNDFEVLHSIDGSEDFVPISQIQKVS